MWYIIRHGETLENKLGIKQGHKNTLLTLKGVNQAISIAYRIKEKQDNFSSFQFVSSPLSRTKHTLQIIMEVLGVENKPIITDELLISRSKGIFEGLEKKEIQEKFPNEYKKQLEDTWNNSAPNGESRASAYKRMCNFVEKYKNSENLIIVGHNGENNFIKQILLGKTEEEIKNNIKKSDKSQNYFYCWNKKIIERI